MAAADRIGSGTPSARPLRRRRRRLAGAIATALAVVAATKSLARVEEGASWFRPNATATTLAIGEVPLHLAYPGNDESPPGDDRPASAAPVFGAADSLRLNLIGGVVSNLSDTNGGTARAEFEYFMVERLSIVPVAEIGWLGQDEGEDAALAGGAVLLRWHLVHRPRWTLYADAGVGLAYLGADVPPETNRIKFSPQIGVGFTLAVDSDPSAARLVGGLRWYHLSNARTAPSNEGFDGLMVYLGVGVPF